MKMKIKCTILLLVFMQAFAHAMEISQLREIPEVKQAAAQQFILDEVSDLLGTRHKYLLHDNWGLIFWAYEKMDKTAQEALQQILLCLKVADLLEEDPFEGENLLVDLVSWVRQEPVALLKVIHGAVTIDGSVNYTVLEPLLKELFEKYRAKAFKLSSGTNLCCLDNEIVAYFPHLRICKETYNKNEYRLEVSKKADYEDKRQLEEDSLEKTTKGEQYDIHTLIAFKKLLYLFYGIQNMFKMPFDQCNELVVNQGTLGASKQPLRVSLENDTLCNQHHSELLELALNFDILPLVKLLLTSLKQEEAHTVDAYNKNIDLKYFPTIAKIMGHSNFMAHFVVRKLNLVESADLKSPFVSECLASLAQSIEGLKIDCTVPSDVSVKIYKQTPFYQQLDPKLQETFKSLIIDTYAIPTFKTIQTRGSGDAAGHLEDTILYYFSDNFRIDIDAISDNKPGHFTFHLEPSTCLSKFLHPHQKKGRWFMMGNEQGVIKLHQIGLHEKTFIVLNPLSINPLPGSGKVTKIIQNGFTIIAAYHSGAIGCFDLSKSLPQTGEKPAVIESKPEMYLSLGNEALVAYKNPPINQLETKGRYTIAVLNQQQQNDSSSYLNSLVKIWEGTHLIHPITLTHEVVCMLCPNDDKVALGCSDGTVIILDLHEAKIVERIHLSKKPVCALATCGQKDTYLAIAYCRGQKQIVWDLTSNRVVKELKRKKIYFRPLVALYVLKKNKAIIESIYDNGTLERAFIPECAQMSDVIDVLQNKLL